MSIIDNYKNEQLVKLQEMDPIIDLIIYCTAKPSSGEYYFEIVMAPGHVFDHDKLLSIFREDCTLTFQEGALGVLSGTCRDENVGSYLYTMALKRKKQ